MKKAGIKGKFLIAAAVAMMLTGLWTNVGEHRREYTGRLRSL